MQLSYEAIPVYVLIGTFLAVTAVDFTDIFPMLAFWGFS